MATARIIAAASSAPYSGVIITFQETPEQASGASSIAMRRRVDEGVSQTIYPALATGHFTKYHIGIRERPPFMLDFSNSRGISDYRIRLFNVTGGADVLTDFINYSDIPVPTSSTWRGVEGHAEALYHDPAGIEIYGGPDAPASINIVQGSRQITPAWQYAPRLMDIDEIADLRWRIAVGDGTGETTRKVITVSSTFDPSTATIQTIYEDTNSTDITEFELERLSTTQIRLTVSRASGYSINNSKQVYLADSFGNFVAMDSGDGPWTVDDTDSQWTILNDIDAEHKLMVVVANSGTIDPPEASRVTSEEFTLEAVNGSPIDITMDNVDLWVLDTSDRYIYAYYRNNNTRDTDYEVDLDSDNSSPRGVTDGGGRLWVSDSGDDKIYAYSVTSGDADSKREADDDFELHTDNASPGQIWYDSDYIYVIDTGDTFVYCYNAFSGLRDGAREFDLTSDNSNPVGIWGDDDHIWISDAGDEKLYAYDRTDGSYAASQDVELEDYTDGQDVDILGISGNDDYWWVLDTDASPDEVRAYSRPAEWGVWDTVCVVAGRTQHTITELINEVLYLIQVRTIDSGGRSSWAGVFDGPRTPDAPDPVTPVLSNAKGGPLAQW